MKVKKALIKGFDSMNYRAVVQLAGSQKVYLEDIAVSRSIPAVEMVNGRKAAVIFFDEHNPKEAVVIAVYV